VKVVLSKEQDDMLTELCVKLGTGKSEAIRMLIMVNFKELGLMRETLHSKKQHKKESTQLRQSKPKNTAESPTG